MKEDILPTSVWLYYHPSKKTAIATEEVARFSQIIFQRVLSDEDYLRLIDAQNGEQVRIFASRVGPKEPFFPSIQIRLTRWICCGIQTGHVNIEYFILDKGNGPVLLLQGFEVPPFAQGKGLATQMFAAQVATARTFGFHEIVTDADHEKGRNGYYTWPRLGFDKQFTSEEKTYLDPKFRHLVCLSDLMELPEARTWWDTNAPTHRFDFEVSFNTSPTSRSMQNLQASLGRLEGKDGYWDRGPHGSFT